MTTYARITTDADGRICDESTLTIDGHTTPIPQRAEFGGRMAPRRIIEALAARGYQPATNYYDDLINTAAGYEGGYFDMAIAPLGERL